VVQVEIVMGTTHTLGVEAKGARPMTTEDIIIHIFVLSMMR
jgi:hypothetical protein